VGNLKGVAERGSRTKGRRGGVWPKAEKKKVTRHFDGGTDHFHGRNGRLHDFGWFY